MVWRNNNGLKNGGGLMFGFLKKKKKEAPAQ
jgi:hypothetical protein